MQSDSINELVAALVKVQSSLQPAPKDKNNPFFHSKYADLAGVWAACQKLLTENNLVVIQTHEPNETGVVLITTLAHVSGQYIQGKFFVPVVPVTMDKNDQQKRLGPQGFVAATTYARRAALAAIVGVVVEDDDGNMASGRAEKEARKPSPPQDSAAGPTPPAPSAGPDLPEGAYDETPETDEISEGMKKAIYASALSNVYTGEKGKASPEILKMVGEWRSSVLKHANKIQIQKLLDEQKNGDWHQLSAWMEKHGY